MLVGFVDLLLNDLVCNHDNNIFTYFTTSCSRILVVVVVVVDFGAGDNVSL